MGKTYRHSQSRFDDERSAKKNKPGHTSGKKSGGMRIVNDPFLDDDDYFDDDVSIEDEIVINKISDENS